MDFASSTTSADLCHVALLFFLGKIQISICGAHSQKIARVSIQIQGIQRVCERGRQGMGLKCFQGKSLGGLGNTAQPFASVFWEKELFFLKAGKGTDWEVPIGSLRTAPLVREVASLPLPGAGCSLSILPSARQPPPSSPGTAPPAPPLLRHLRSCPTQTPTRG